MLLAAGASRRMGRPKALLPHPDGSGRSVVRALAETLGAAGLSPVFVVLGHARTEVAAELGEARARSTPVPNPAWRSGMLSSLKAGACAAAGHRKVEWALVTLVDQPFLSEALVRRLTERALAARAPGEPPPAAVAPADPERRRAGRFGHPILLSRRLFPEVLAETPRTPEDEDRGAHRILARHSAEIALVPADPRELATMETPDDYTRLRAARKSQKAPTTDS